MSGTAKHFRWWIGAGLIGCTASSLVVGWVMGTASQAMLHVIQAERAAPSISLELAAAGPIVRLGGLILGMLVSLIAGVRIGVLLQLNASLTRAQQRRQLSAGQPAYTYRPRRRLPLLGAFEASCPVRQQPQPPTGRLLKAYRPEPRTRCEAGRH